MATQGDNQLDIILKSFIQETKNQFQAHGASIKNLDNQVRQITYTLSSRTMGTLLSSTEKRTYTFIPKRIEMCKIISLRNGKEYDGASQQNTKQPRKDLKTSDTSEEEGLTPPTTTPLVEVIKEGLQAMQPILKTSSTTLQNKNFLLIP